MQYGVEIKPQALKDGKKISKNTLERILNKIERMKDGLSGDIKRLTNFTPEYRLRVGDYRVLFNIENDTIVVYRIIHRKNAYR